MEEKNQGSLEDYEHKVQVDVVKHKQITQDPDSIEIGSPSKKGRVKIYGSFDKPEEFKKKIDSAIEVQRYANEQVRLKL